MTEVGAIHPLFLDRISCVFPHPIPIPEVIDFLESPSHRFLAGEGCTKTRGPGAVKNDFLVFHYDVRKRRFTKCPDPTEVDCARNVAHLIAGAQLVALGIAHIDEDYPPIEQLFRCGRVDGGGTFNLGGGFIASLGSRYGANSD